MMNSPIGAAFSTSRLIAEANQSHLLDGLQSPVTRFVSGKLRTALLTLTLGVGLMAVMDDRAFAASTDCNTLNAAAYSASSNGNFSLNSFQLFTLDAGEVISFSANVPAGARVTITFTGIMVVLDNSASATAQTLSGSITVPSSGTTTTSAVLIAVTGLITGGSTTVNFDCAGVTAVPPANNANNNAAPVVAPVATPVSIIPPINPQYGAVADAGVEAFLTAVPGFGFGNFPFNNLLNIPAVALAKKTCNDLAIEIIEARTELAVLDNFSSSAEENKAQKVFDDANKVFKDAGCDEKISTPAGPGGAFGPDPSPLPGINRPQSIRLRNGKNKTCNDLAIEIIEARTELAVLDNFSSSAEENKAQNVFDDAKKAFKDAGCDEKISTPASPGGAFGPDPSPLPGINRPQSIRLRNGKNKTCNDLAIEIIEARTELAVLDNFSSSAEENKAQKVFDDAKKAFKDAGCNEEGATSNYIPFRKFSPGTIAINKATGASSLNAPYKYSAVLTPGIGGGIVGRFALSNPKAKRPWVLFFNSGISGLDDNRIGADRRSRVWNAAIGGSIQWNPKTTIGITGGYSQGKLTSKANASKLIGDYFSVTISGNRKLMKSLSLGISAGYTHGENTLEIGGGSGEFGVDVFNASASLSGSFKLQELTIAPSISAGISRVKRDGYTDSLGIIVPGSEKTHGNIGFGASISKSFNNIDGFKSITPSISLGGGYFIREKFDATLASGTVAKQLGFGANLAAGLAMQMDDGMGINVGGSYGLFQNDIQTWSFSASLVKKF